MKKVLRFTVWVISLFFIQSCIPSLHPLYTSDKLVRVEALEGVWKDIQGEKKIQKREKVLGEEKDVVITLPADDTSLSSMWDFRRKDDGQFLLIHTDDSGKKAAFDIHIIRLGGDLYMDFYPAELPKEEREKDLGMFESPYNDLFSYHILPVHTFAKLKLDGDSLKIMMFDPDFLEKLLERRQIRIKHEKLEEGGYVLTAPSEELQKFVEKYGNEKEAYIRDMVSLTKADDH